MNVQQEQREAVVNLSNDAIAATPGEMLQMAREQAGLAIGKVAGDLRLDTRTVELIEANRFKDLGAPVYAKGYLRKYARLVGLPEEAILSAYEICADIPVIKDPVPATVGLIPRPRQLLPRWALWSLAALMVIAVAVTLLQPRAAPAFIASISSPQSTIAAGNLVPENGESGKQAASPLLATGISAAEAASPAASVSTAGQIALQLKFAGGDSWVEIYDANNQQVFYELGRDTSERQVSGLAPLRVVLGSADNVKLRANGQDVVIPAGRIAANVARFVVTANGAIE